MKKDRQYVDYDFLYTKLKEEGPLSYSDIKRLTGLTKKSAVGQVITTLSIKYPIWQPAVGLYKLCESSDYQTVNWDKLKEE